MLLSSTAHEGVVNMTSAVIPNPLSPNNTATATLYSASGTFPADSTFSAVEFDFMVCNGSANAVVTLGDVVV